MMPALAGGTAVHPGVPPCDSWEDECSLASQLPSLGVPAHWDSWEEERSLAAQSPRFEEAAAAAPAVVQAPEGGSADEPAQRPRHRGGRADRGGKSRQLHNLFRGKALRKVYNKFCTLGLLPTNVAYLDFQRSLLRTLQALVDLEQADVGGPRAPHEPDPPRQVSSFAADEMVVMMHLQDDQGVIPMLPAASQSFAAIDIAGAASGSQPRTAEEAHFEIVDGEQNSQVDPDDILVGPAEGSEVPPESEIFEAEARARTLGGERRQQVMTPARASIVYGMGYRMLRTWGFSEADIQERGGPLHAEWRHPGTRSGVGAARSRSPRPSSASAAAASAPAAASSAPGTRSGVGAPRSRSPRPSSASAAAASAPAAASSAVAPATAAVPSRAELQRRWDALFAGMEVPASAAEEAAEAEVEGLVGQAFERAVAVSTMASRDPDLCTICLEEARPRTAGGFPFDQLLCGHRFHTHCLHRWQVAGGRNCPVCRQGLRSALTGGSASLPSPPPYARSAASGGPDEQWHPQRPQRVSGSGPNIDLTAAQEWLHAFLDGRSWPDGRRLRAYVPRIDSFAGGRTFEEVTVGAAAGSSMGDPPNGPYWFRCDIPDLSDLPGRGPMTAGHRWLNTHGTETAYHGTSLDKVFSIVSSGGLRAGAAHVPAGIVPGDRGVFCHKMSTRKYCSSYQYYFRFDGGLRAGCILELHVCRSRIRKVRTNQWILPEDMQKMVALWVHIVPDSCSDFETDYWTHDWSPELEWPIGGGRALSQRPRRGRLSAATFRPGG